MSTRGRKPPEHTPLVCTSCGEAPRLKDGEIQPCACGQAWNLELLKGARRPKWLPKED